MRYYHSVCLSCGAETPKRRYPGYVPRDVEKHNCFEPKPVVRRTTRPERAQDDVEIEQLAKTAVRAYIRMHPFFADQFEELLSDAYLGYARARASHDSEKSPFKPYAHLRMRGSIIDGLRGRGHLSRGDFKKMSDADGELAVSKMRPLSLDALLNPEEGIAPYEPAYLDRGLFDLEMKNFVDLLMDGLPENELLVIRWRYWEDRLMSDIGARLRVTESRVSQIHKSAIDRMRRMAARDGG